MPVSPSLDDFVRSCQDRGRDREPEYLRGLQVDGELEHRRPLDRQVCGARPLEYSVHVVGCTTEEVSEVRPIAHQAPRSGELGEDADAGQTILEREISETLQVQEHRRR